MILFRVSGAISPLPFMTRETVETETPASLAISFRLTTKPAGILPSVCFCTLQIVTANRYRKRFADSMLIITYNPGDVKRGRKKNGDFPMKFRKTEGKSG